MPRDRISKMTFLTMAGFALMTGAPLSAQDTTTALTREQVEEAYSRDDKAAARAGLLGLVDDGDPVLNYRLGYMMAEGQGGPVDLEGAVPYLELAANEGHVPSLTLLARVYLSGAPELSDYQRAAQLLEAAVAADVKEARFLLAQLLRQGRGIAVDLPRAAALLEAAANEGESNAQFHISQMYSRGEGIEKDLAQAARWLLEAADNGSGEAQLSLSFNYERGSGFPKSEEKSLKWLAVAANNNVPLAQRMLGTSYLFGDRLEADHEKAIIWLTRAAEAGEPGAQSNLGYAFYTGTGVQQNDAEAFRWYSAAADNGLIRAIAAVAGLHEAGRGTPEDFGKAIEYYHLATRLGDEQSLIRLGIMIADGRVDISLDEENAPVWVSAAAAEGHGPAVHWLQARVDKEDMYAATLLAILKREGKGVDVDQPVAIALFEAAAQAGEPVAQLHLSEIYARGEGVEQDYVLAHKWANLAATFGLDEAKTARDTVEQLMSADEIAEAQRAAREQLEQQ